MDKNLGLILKDMLFAAILLCPAMFLSCSYDTEADDCSGSDGPVTMQLQITAEKETDLNTRADFTGEEEPGTTGEYMHNLCVLFVSADGTIVKRINADEKDDNPAVQEGNLRVYSETFQIDPGTYTVYAFANIDSYYNGYKSDWTSLTSVDEGTTIESLRTESGIDINNIVLEDPASKLDLIDYFIPMSAKETVVIDENTTSVSIGLDRLVSKVRVNISGKAGSKLTSFTFGNYADRVGLFSDQTLTDVEYKSSKESTQQIEFPSDGEISLNEFYVNETRERSNATGFTVELETDEMGGTKYSSVTKTTLYLPRNSILPLNLTLNDYGLDLSGWYSVAPIDHAPVRFIADFDTQDSYSVKIPEGAQFHFEIVGVTPNPGGQQDTPTSCYWYINPDVVEKGFVFNDYSNGAQYVDGYVTASKGLTFPFTVQVEWTHDDGKVVNDYNRTYTVNVTTTDITDVDFDDISGTRSENTKVNNLKPEVLNMFIKR